MRRRNFSVTRAAISPRSTSSRGDAAALLDPAHAPLDPVATTVGFTIERGVTQGSLVASPGDDIADARAVSDRLGIAHYVFDHESAFREDVVEQFADEYMAGRTPVPCIRCNMGPKFTDLFKMARELGADYTFYSEDDPVQEVLRLTGGQGADVVFDCSGGEAAITQATRMVKNGGWVSVIGLWGHDLTVNLDRVPYNNLTLRGSWGWMRLR